MASSPMQTPERPDKQKDRRKFTRFTPKSGTMAVSNHALGPIINISMGGFSFQYLDDTNNTLNSNLFGIFLGSEDILIDKIEGVVVLDRQIAQNSPFMQTRTRQRSIQFLDLTPEQKEKLENFILTKTQGAA